MYDKVNISVVYVVHLVAGIRKPQMCIADKCNSQGIFFSRRRSITAICFSFIFSLPFRFTSYGCTSNQLVHDAWYKRMMAAPKPVHTCLILQTILLTFFGGQKYLKYRKAQKNWEIRCNNVTNGKKYRLSLICAVCPDSLVEWMKLYIFVEKTDKNNI